MIKELKLKNWKSFKEATLYVDPLTIGKQRNIDIIITTHNPAMLDAAGVRMIPFITVVHRDHSSGISKLSQLEDINLLPKLMASGSLGKLNTEGRIESALKQKGMIQEYENKI